MEARTIIGAIAAVAAIAGISFALHSYSSETYDYPPFNLVIIGISFVCGLLIGGGRVPLVGSRIHRQHACRFGRWDPALCRPAGVRDPAFQHLDCNRDGDDFLGSARGRDLGSTPCVFAEKPQASTNRRTRAGHTEVAAATVHGKRPSNARSMRFLWYLGGGEHGLMGLFGVAPDIILIDAHTRSPTTSAGSVSQIVKPASPALTPRNSSAKRGGWISRRLFGMTWIAILDRP